jgi:hypothetical protein
MMNQIPNLGATGSNPVGRAKIEKAAFAAFFIFVFWHPDEYLARRASRFD